jgi:hypothetical protein
MRQDELIDPSDPPLATAAKHRTTKLFAQEEDVGETITSPPCRIAIRHCHQKMQIQPLSRHMIVVTVLVWRVNYYAWHRLWSV